MTLSIEALRLDDPMWGKAKLVVLWRREGFAVSASTVGRIRKSLMARGVVTPVPRLRRKPGGRRFRLIGKTHAQRLPEGLKPTRPGEIVQLDTVFITQAPGKTHKHFTAYDPVARWTVASTASRAIAKLATRFLDKIIANMPFEVSGIRSLPPAKAGVDGDSEFMAEFEQACQTRKLASMCCRPSGPRRGRALQRRLALRILRLLRSPPSSR